MLKWNSTPATPWNVIPSDVDRSTIVWVRGVMSLKEIDPKRMRFAVGDRVLCTVPWCLQQGSPNDAMDVPGGRGRFRHSQFVWKTGTVSAHGYHGDDFPEGVRAAYAVKLDDDCSPPVYAV